jgi:CMP-N-acetylneuraminic acid synthetase
VVTSDCDEILKVCSAYDVELHKRPAKLATDSASSLDVIEDVLVSYHYEGLACLLQPTSPLRTARTIREAYVSYIAKGCKSLVGVVATEEPAQKNTGR